MIYTLLNGDEKATICVEEFHGHYPKYFLFSFSFQRLALSKFNIYNNLLED